MGKANGTIRCRISAEKCRSAENCRPHVEAVIFTPETLIKFGKCEFVAFVPEEGDGGFVAKLSNGSIKLRPDGFVCPHLLSQAALGNMKVTVIASQPEEEGRRPELKALVVPAE